MIENSRNSASSAKVLFILAAVISIGITYSLQSEDNAFFVLGVCVLFELFVYLIANKRMMISLMNYATIFVITLFVFHFGQVVLLAFATSQIQTYQMRIVLNYFDEETCLHAMRLINMAFCAIAAGTLNTRKVKFVLFKKNNVKVKKYWTEENARKYASIMIVATFPIKLFIDVMLVLKSFTIGFFSASHWLQSVPNFIRAYGNIAFVGIALLIVALKSQSRKQNFVYMLTITYLLILMLSGWRAENVCYVIIITYLYVASRSEKIKISRIVMISIMAYLLIAVLYAVVAVRFSVDRSFDAYLDAFLRVTVGDRNVILEALREYGNTGYTAVCVLEIYLKKFMPSLGESYILGLSAIFPNLTGLAGRLTTESTFALTLQDTNSVLSAYHNIGGSIIGEVFFNFGVGFGIVFSYIIGLFIGKTSTRAQNSIREHDLYNLSISIPIMFGTLFWIRDAFGSGVREVVWGIAFCWFVRHIRVKQ